MWSPCSRYLLTLYLRTYIRTYLSAYLLISDVVAVLKAAKYVEPDLSGALMGSPISVAMADLFALRA